MRRANHDLVDLKLQIVEFRELSIAVINLKKGWSWLPKSQIEYDADTGEVTMPEWLALEKELI